MSQRETEKKQNVTVFSPGSERNILSICLRNEESINDVEGADIYAEHFSVPAHKYIYMALLYLYQKQIKPEPMSIMEIISGREAKKSIEDIGGLEYLTILSETHVPASNLKIFIEKVRQAFTRRKLLDIANDVMDFVSSAQAETLNPSELVSYAEQQLNDVSIQVNRVDEVYKMGTHTEAVLEERAKTPSAVPGLEVGWVEYDRVTNGAQPGDLIVVCAPSKTGKSVTLTNWATKIAIKDQLPILYIDTEMNEREQEDRILAILTNIPVSEIMSGMYVMDTINGTAKEKLAKLKKAREELGLGHYYHIYMPQFDIAKVTALARKFQTQIGIVALFFDYIKIPSSEGSFRNVQEYQALGFFTSGLKDLAGTLKIPVFTACQANRNNTANENPGAGDIGGSYRILQLASKLMFLYNKSDEKIAKDGFQNGNQQLHIAFQRNGESGCDPINVMFDRATVTQKEV